MLDKLFLQFLSPKGKIAYWVGQITLFALWAFYLLGIAEYSLDGGRTLFFLGMIVLLIIWGGICLLIWKKPKENENTNPDGFE